MDYSSFVDYVLPSTGLLSALIYVGVVKCPP